MVYFIAGERFEGSKPPTTSSTAYNRAPSVFSKFDIEAAKKAFWGQTTDSSGESSAVSPKKQKLSGQAKYYLYIASACPWAHRASLVRALLGLQEQVLLSVVETVRDDKVGWSFAQTSNDDQKSEEWGSDVVPSKDRRGTGYKYLYEVYLKSCSDYTGNITTPVLTNSEGNILSNESWDVARALVVLSGQKEHPIYPLEGEGAEARRNEIDTLARTLHDDFNNGVYRAGLAKAQSAHEQAAKGVHAILSAMEDRLVQHRYLLPGNHPTLADWQFFASLLRFDSVYGPLFKCMLRRLTSYHNVYNYTCDLLQSHPEIRATIHPRHISQHYWSQFTSSNPNGVVAYDNRIEQMAVFRHNRNEMAQKHLQQVQADKASMEQDQSNKAQEQSKGNFVRGVSGFRNWVTPGGEFDVEPGRYHVYVAANCPWCHRVMLGRSVMGLENVISMDLLFYRRNDEGLWQFLPEEKELLEFERGNEALIGGVASSDSVHGKKTVREIYPTGSTEKSVPILYDKKLNVIVNNESSEILRMFETVFAPLSRLASPPALYPTHSAWLIEEINTWVYTDIANGAYRAGFSSAQEAYEQARAVYFAGLARADDILARRKFLCGEHVSEADIRLFPPVYRHDPVYYMRMKLTQAMIRDYPNLQRWLTQMLQVPGVQEASRIQHCLHGYFGRTGSGLVPTIVTQRDAWY